MNMTKVFAMSARVLLTTACALACTTAWGQGVDNNSVFQLDGNTKQDAGNTGLDWESAFPAGTPKTTIPLQDPAPASIFTTGGSKDGNNLNQWRWKDGSVPDKDNITQAAAVALQLPQSAGTAIYFSAARFDNSGDAQMGFWFLQQKALPQSDGTFGPAAGTAAAHVNGDLLLLVNFENGGLVPTIQAYKWQGGATGGPVLVGTLKTGECGVGPNAGSLDACAITNVAAFTAPASWSYVPKSGAAGTFPAQTFFEGAVNLNAIFTGSLPCFSSFLVETRSSSSITATLKDFSQGGFDLCKISLTKSCPAGTLVNNGTQAKYTFSGSVKNEGAGIVYDVVVRENPGATGTQTPPNDIVVAASIAPGATVGWTADFVTTSIGFTNSATALAASSSGADRTVTASATAECSTPVNSAVSVTKLCSPGTSLFDAGPNIIVRVGVSGQVCNEGNTTLTGVALSHDPTAVVTLGTTTLKPKGDAAACTSWSVNYDPPAISTTPDQGRYGFTDTIKVTAATPSVGLALDLIATGTCAHSYACATITCPLCPAGTCVQ